jgi:hypothetical protein
MALSRSEKKTEAELIRAVLNDGLNPPPPPPDRQISTPKTIVYKDVDGKAPLSLLPWAGLAKVAWVRAYGDAKYEPDSWRKVPGATTVYVDAALRHLGAHADGERTDPESGLSHLSHAACNLLFLLALDADVESD